MALMNKALKEFWRTQSRIRILKGGRSSSKTWDTAGRAIWLASKYKLKFLCTRQYQNRIDDSVYAILVDQIDRFGLRAEFKIQKNVIEHIDTGSSFHFYGILRNLAEIKGFEGADVCWVEEGEAFTKEQLKTIKPTLRKQGAELWILYNPRFVHDYVETLTHDPDKGVLVRHINYDENPFLSETMLQDIKWEKENDYDDYEHYYLGVPWSDDDRVVIKRSWIEAAIDAHLALGIEVKGDCVIGFDIADAGKDLCAQIKRVGIVAVWGEHWQGKEDELLESCKRVYDAAYPARAKINYDSIGVGASAGGKFKELNTEKKIKNKYHKDIAYAKFNAAGGVIAPESLYVDDGIEGKIKNKDFFENAKAQAWWLVADRFKNTYNAITKGQVFKPEELISISSEMPNLDNLKKELSTPRRDESKNGKVMVESKKELAKREVESPNDADAFIMCYAKTQVVIKRRGSW